MPSTLVYLEREIPWAELEDAVLHAASLLERLGVGEDDVVCIMLRNDPAFLAAAFAALRLGAYSCPINWHYKAEEAGWILADSGAKALVAHADLLPQIEDALPAGVGLAVVEPQDWKGWLKDEPRWSGAPRRLRGNMPYTSGTTGRPKGVRRAPMPLEGAERMAELAREARYKGFGIEPGMRGLLPGPLYHSAPNLYAIQTLQLEDALLVLEPRFDAERTLELPDEVKRRYDLSSLRFVASTGSPCAPAVKRAMIDWWGPVFHECYASSEAGVITSIDSHEALRKPGSAGRPVGVGALRILDEQGRELPPGKVGLIYARQPAYPDFSYNNNPSARAALERDGLWTLGDMGYVDEDGYLFICDRASDMVISGGVNIYPAEIEAVLHGMPGVHDCAVFGVPSEEFGEALAAAIQPDPGAALDPEQVKTWLRARIADYKVPRTVELRSELPREDSGKIFKRKLREPYWEKAGRRI
jgi:long-chain acyl-CoA synthetase